MAKAWILVVGPNGIEPAEEGSDAAQSRFKLGEWGTKEQAIALSDILVPVFVASLADIPAHTPAATMRHCAWLLVRDWLKENIESTRPFRPPGRASSSS